MPLTLNERIEQARAILAYTDRCEIEAKQYVAALRGIERIEGVPKRNSNVWSHQADMIERELARSIGALRGIAEEEVRILEAERDALPKLEEGTK